MDLPHAPACEMCMRLDSICNKISKEYSRSLPLSGRPCVDPCAGGGVPRGRAGAARRSPPPAGPGRGRAWRGVPSAAPASRAWRERRSDWRVAWLRAFALVRRSLMCLVADAT